MICVIFGEAARFFGLYLGREEEVREGDGLEEDPPSRVHLVE